MKQRLIAIAYWTIAVFITAIVLCIFEEFSFIKAVLLGILLLPAALIVKFTFPSIIEKPTIRRILDLCLLAATVCIIGGVLFLVGGAIVSNELYVEQGIYLYHYVPVPGSPLFPIIVILFAVLFCIGDWFLTRYMRRNMPQEPVSLTFISDRRPVTILQSDILYVESNDDETWVHSTDGQSYRNKTPISQWEKLLGMDFLRIHRSFLVARAHIGTVKADTLVLDNGDELPVSRKYRSACQRYNRD